MASEKIFLAKGTAWIKMGESIGATVRLWLKRERWESERWAWTEWKDDQGHGRSRSQPAGSGLYSVDEAQKPRRLVETKQFTSRSETGQVKHAPAGLSISTSWYKKYLPFPLTLLRERQQCKRDRNDSWHVALVLGRPHGVGGIVANWKPPTPLKGTSRYAAPAKRWPLGVWMQHGQIFRLFKRTQSLNFCVKSPS